MDAQCPQRSAVPIRLCSAPCPVVRLICCWHPCQQQGYLVVAVRGGLNTRLCPCARVTPQLGSTSPFTVAVLCCPAGCWAARITEALPAFVLSATKKTPPNPIILVSMFLDSRREDLLHDSRNCVAAFCDRHAEFSTKQKVFTSYIGKYLYINC